ncbi:MAG: hypothetical protein AB2693_28535 [Candidatus Thiodiazotropha sp.]
MLYLLSYIQLESSGTSRAVHRVAGQAVPVGHAETQPLSLKYSMRTWYIRQVSNLNG